MKVLITGATGFSASHLISLLSHNSSLQMVFTDLQFKGGANWHVCDLTSTNDVFHLLNKTKPEQIYHLAGSYSNEYDVDYRVNVLTTKNLIDNCLRLNLKCRILLIGSSAEYGLVSEKDNPVNEDHPLRPVSIYGLTKVYQTHLMNFYYTTHKIDVVMARTFNLMGKGISNKLFIGHLYEQLDKYKEGRISKIVMGNLQHKRDYIPVEEAVKDYERIMNLGTAGEIYNVGLGKSIRIHQLLEEILKDAGLDIGIVEEKIENTQNRFDVPDIFADIQKLNRLRSISQK